MPKCERPLSQRSSITIKLGYHDDTSIQWTLTPNPNLLKPWSEPKQDHQTMGQVGFRLRSGPQLWVSNGVNMWLRPCGLVMWSQQKSPKKRHPKKMLPDIWLRDMVKTRVANFIQKHVITATTWCIFFSRNMKEVVHLSFCCPPTADADR